DAYGKHVLIEQEGRDIEAEGGEVAVMASQQAAVQPDVRDQERPLEAYERPLPVLGPGKARPIPYGLVARGRAVQSRHLGRAPGVVIKVGPGETPVLALAEGGDGHPPARGQLLPVERLDREEREAVVQRHAANLNDPPPAR